MLAEGAPSRLTDPAISGWWSTTCELAASWTSAGAELLRGRGLDFHDPWGNHVQVVQYSDMQFSKSPPVLAGMGLGKAAEVARRARRAAREGPRLGALEGGGRVLQRRGDHRPGLADRLGVAPGSSRSGCARARPTRRA